MSVWNDDRLEWAKKLWLEGKSAGDISIASKGVLTRSAVLGKMHRLGLVRTEFATAVSSRKPPRPRAPRAKAAVVAAAPALASPVAPDSPAPSPMAATPEIPFAAAAIVPLTGACKWPVGDPGEPGFGYCGRPSPKGRAYCDHHHKAAYQPQTAKTSGRELERSLRRYA